MMKLPLPFRGLQRWLAGVLLAGITGLAQAAYPEQPIKLLVGFPPGGGGDLYGRAIATELGKQLGQSVVVDNRVGAGGNIAADVVAKAKPDGYTLILAMSGNFGTAPAMRATLPYKVPGDFVPIAQLVETPFGLMVSGNSPIRSAQEFIAAARPGKLSYASTGTGGAAQVVMEMVKQAGKLDILHIPYKGSGPALTDLIGGQVQFSFAAPAAALTFITNGRLKALAVSGDARLPAMPQVPTFTEAGMPGFHARLWFGFLAKAGTPPALVEKLAADIGAVMDTPEMKERLLGMGLDRYANGPEAYGAQMKADLARYADLVKKANIKLEN